MIHPDTELRFKDAVIGHAVYATRFIPRGTIVWTLCALDILLTPARVRELPDAYRAIVDRYAYCDADGDLVLCWDHGRYVNHSCDPAMVGIGPKLDVAMRDLHPGDELTCDYGLLNLVEPLACRCGAPRCRGTIASDDMLRLVGELDVVAAGALAAAREVAQPLLPFVRDRAAWDALRDGRAAVPSARLYYHAAP